MQFKDLGNLFNSFGEMSSARFKGVTSISDMLGWQKGSFNDFLRLDSSGISKYTMEEIKAKSAVLGLTDELTAQAVALAKDADFTAKASTGKLTYGKAILNNIDDIDKIADALEKSGKIPEQQAKILSTLTKGSDEYNQYIKNIINGTDDIADSIIDIGTSAQSSSTALSTYFKGILATIKPLVPAIAAVAVAFAAFKAWDYSQHGFSRAVEDAENAALEYENVKSNLQSLNSELDTTKSKIQELESLQENGTITFTQEIELDNLRETNSELERQIDIQKSLLEIKKQASAQAAVNASNKKQTYTEAMEEEYGGFWGKIYAFLTDNGGTYVSNTTGEVIKTGSKSEEWYKKYGEDSTIQGQVKGNINALEEYKNELIDIEKQLKDNPTDEALLSREDELNNLIDDTTTSLADQSNTLQGWIDACTDENGAIIEGYETQVEAWKTALTLIQNIGKSQKEIDLNNLNNYFSSTGGKTMKKYLEDIVKSGGSAEDALKAFKETGMSLDDIGVSSDGFVRYFQDLAKSANETANAVKEVNNNLTMDDIATAFESKNAGDNYVSLNDYLKKAKELYDQGLTGTDDFKSVAEAISYNIDSSSESFKQNYDKLQRYFIEDGDGNLTGQGVQNFLTDLQNLGKGYATWNAEAGKWDINMSNTAQAAKDLGVSVQTMEAVLGRIKDYDNLGEFDFTSAIDEFETAKSSLESLRSLYDEMESSDRKDALGLKLDEWESQLGTWKNDLATLDSDVVLNIKLEYDLATIQSQIDEVKGLIEGGDNSVENNAQVIAGNQKYINTAEEGLGLNVEGVTVPVEYQANEDTIEALKAQLKNATSEEDKVKIQAEIENLQEIQKQLLDSFATAHPEINADSSIDEINAAWNDFISSTDGQEIIAKMTADDKEAKEKIAELLDIEPEDIVVPVSADTSNAEKSFNHVEAYEFSEKVAELTANDDATPYLKLWNELSMNPKFGIMKAEDQATYVVALWNALTPEQKEAYLKGEITVTDNATGTVQTVDGALNALPLNPNAEITAKDLTSGAVSSANLALNSIDGKTAHTYIITHKKTVGGDNLSGTAHVGGTAHASGILNDDSWIKPQWRTKKDEVSLVGEEAPELVATRQGTWYTVGDKGAEFAHIPKDSVVFDAKQTKELLTKGSINGRGKAYLGGTAYAGSSTGGFYFSGGASKYNNASTKSYPSTTTKKTNTDTVSKAAQAATQAAEDLFDFVEILSDRTKETTEKLTDVINDAVNLADKMSKNSSALTQVQKEISVNQQAYQKYLAQANAVGLAEGYASQIRNGSLNIENITDEDLKKKIDNYQKWYDKAKNAQNAIRDLQKDEKELALSRLEYIEDYYDALVSLNDAYKDVNDARLDYLEKLGSSAITDDIKGYYQNSYVKEYDSYGKALQQLADYTQEVNELLANNYLQEGSEGYLEAMKTIQEFTKQVDESAIALIELEDKIRAIDYTKLQQIIDGSNRRTDQLKNAQSLAEARDELIGRDELQKQVNELSKSINANYELRDKKLQEQNLYDVTSTRYQDLAKEIADLDNEIYGNLIDIENLKNQIFEAEFFNYEKEQENLEYFIGELDDFAKLLNSEGYFDKNGAFTDEAYAKITLTAEAMTKCKQETANATEALKKLDEMYQNGLISETEYTDKQRDLLDTVRKSTLATEDYKNELLDLYTEQIQKENDALKESISLRQKALKSQKSYWDYADSIKSKTKDVDALKAQIAALGGVTSASAIATKKKLEAELADAEKSLSDTKRDHTYSLMDEGYSAMSDNLDSSLEDIEYSIATSSEKQLQVVQSMLSQMVSSYQEASSKISSIMSNTGFVGSGSFNDTVTNIGSSTGSSSIANGAAQDQSTIKPSDKVSNINTGNISNGEHGNIEEEIKKEPNTDNRLCAELKISTSSVSVQEGSSTSVSVSIRPNDAKNKTISWSSSDSSIASVSAEGKITGVKPGTATITASTTDGSGLVQTCKVTVTKKPEPPKPTIPSNSNTTQGNGIPDVGDKVTFVSGIYHEDSYGAGRWGNWNLGQSVYITKINPNAPYPIHISTGNRLGSGDRGWLKLNQLRGYNRGSRYINRRQLAFMDDTSNGDLDAGSEVVITNRGILKQFEAGDTVFNNEQVQRLWDLSKDFDMSKFVNLNTSSMLGQLPDIVNRNDNSRNTEVNLNFDSLMTIEGNIYKEAIPGLQKEIDRMIPHISDKLGCFLRSEMKR